MVRGERNRKRTADPNLQLDLLLSAFLRDVPSLSVERLSEGKSSLGDVTVFCHGIRGQEMINIDLLLVYP